MNNNHFILHISLIEGLGPVTVQHIISQLSESTSAMDCYLLSERDWHRLFGLTLAIAHKIAVGLQDNYLLEQELALIQENAISWVSILDEHYPPLLKTIYAPPSILYWQGVYPGHDRAIALVGSRAATPYGAHAAQWLIPELVFSQCAIISGGALGIDSICHKAALDADGKTVAVLGSGLLKVDQNKKLFNEIIARGGSLVSSFPLTMHAAPGNFPARNRIISGLSHGTVVVQAAKKSGALITADYALEQGREVFAVPGPIEDQLSMGCHMLIQQGAKLVMAASDILTEFGWMQTMPQYDAAAQLSVVSLSSLKKQKLAYPPESVQAKAISMCYRPISMDDLSTQLDMNLFATQTLLFDMQMEGLVEQDFTGLWRSK